MGTSAAGPLGRTGCAMAVAPKPLRRGLAGAWLRNAALSPGLVLVLAALALMLRQGGADVHDEADYLSTAACPGQMGVGARGLHARFPPQDATVASLPSPAATQPTAGAPEGSAIFSGVVPAAVCRAVSDLAAPLLEPAAQKRDSVDGEPEFQLDLFEPDDASAERVRASQRSPDVLLLHCPARPTPQDATHNSFLHWRCWACLPAERARRDPHHALAASRTQPATDSPPVDPARRTVPAQRLASAAAGRGAGRRSNQQQRSAAAAVASYLGHVRQALRSAATRQPRAARSLPPPLEHPTASGRRVHVVTVLMCACACQACLHNVVSHDFPWRSYLLSAYASRMPRS